MEVVGLTSQDSRDVGLQLVQLAGLPSLTSISLLEGDCPTQFLNILGTRLTALHLDASYRQVQPRTQIPTAAWRATLQHAARCMALQSLTIPCDTDKELGMVAPALQQLRRLRLNGPGVAVDGDAVVERLLALPHLTSLTWDSAYAHAFQRSYATSACCRWKELGFGLVGPHQLARLPLHSLASPVAWQYLVVDKRTSVAEVQAAAHNATQRCPAGGVWGGAERGCSRLLHFKASRSRGFKRGAGEGDTPPALLRALRPLLVAVPGLTQLAVGGLAWDAELVQALGEVLPRTCTTLELRGRTFTVGAAVQLALSLPWLQELYLATMALAPAAFMAYASGVATLAGGLHVRPCLRRLRALQPVRADGVAHDRHMEGWGEHRAHLAGWPVEVTVQL